MSTKENDALYERADNFILILQGGKGKDRRKCSYLKKEDKDKSAPTLSRVVCAFGDTKVLTV